ncbi:MAG: hypothetical protein WCS65_18140 [Verrucomicrobiae bacterium]
MTAELLDQYSSLCDEVDGFMRDENTDLRCHGSDGSGWVDRKKSIIGHIDTLLQQMRQESFSEPLHPGPIRELRDQVMKKLLKLLLLSRENEHLLLKNSLPGRFAPAYPPAHSNAIRGAYQNAA